MIISEHVSSLELAPEKQGPPLNPKQNQHYAPHPRQEHRTLAQFPHGFLLLRSLLKQILPKEYMKEKWATAMDYLAADLSYKTQSPCFFAVLFYQSYLFCTEVKNEYAFVHSKVACFYSKADWPGG